MATGQDLLPWSNDDIVNLCMLITPFAGSPHGNQLTRISEAVVVKFGNGVRRQEAENQIYAHRYVDDTVLYIPQVYRFFEDSSSGLNVGFIAMEYVPGTSLDALDVRSNVNIAKRTMDAIRQLSTVPIPKSQGPGPVGGGAADGYLWSEDGTGCNFETINDMEAWFNTRLAVVKKPLISLAHVQQLTMRHMDLVRRNICILPDSRICFFDWAFAGFYPAIFEIRNFQTLRGTDDVWFDQLLSLSPKPDAEEEKLLQLLALPAAINDRFSFHDLHSNQVIPDDITPPPSLPPFPDDE